MDWTEIQIFIDAEHTDRAADIAGMTVPYGLYIEDYRDLERDAREIAHIDLIDEELIAKDRTRSILHIYLSPEMNPAEALSFLEERLNDAGISHTLNTKAVREEDWANNWKAYFKPLPVGDKLLICPTWETPGTEAEGRQVLWIDPGMAFGTGGHDTTRLVLEQLQRVITPGTAMLDVGCGSGILAIAGCLLGVKTAVGVDIDKLAVKTAIENGERNGLCSPQYTVFAGDLVDKVEGQYDLITANIVADAIIALSPAVRPFLKPGGTYIVSGIIDTREREVAAALSAAGFTVCDRHQSSGWLCLTCTAKES